MLPSQPASPDEIKPPEAIKLDLEIAKLRAETTDLSARFLYEEEKRVRECRHPRWTAFRTDWLAATVSLLAIVPTIVTVAFTARSYVDQQERQVDSRLSQSQGAIDLVRQLRSPVAEEREVAALLLTAFGRDAVPVLILNLTFLTPNDPDPLIRALRLIRAKPKVSSEKDVVAPLLERAKEIFGAAVLDDRLELDACLHLARALGALAPQCDGRALDLLATLYKRVEEQRPQIPPDNYKAATEEIRASWSRLCGDKKGPAT